jgi:hypothetical protein
MGAGREQLGLNRAYAPADFQDSSAVEFVGRDTGQHLAFENVQPLLSILLESPPCSLWFEEFLTNPSATATWHEGHHIFPLFRIVRVRSKPCLNPAYPQQHPPISSHVGQHRTRRKAELLRESGRNF